MNIITNKMFMVVAINHSNVPFEHAFTLSELLYNFNDVPDLKDTELHYTLNEEFDRLCELGKDEVTHFFMDRALEFPCLIKRIQ